MAISLECRLWAAATDLAASRGLVLAQYCPQACAGLCATDSPNCTFIAADPAESRRDGRQSERVRKLEGQQVVNRFLDGLEATLSL